MKRLGVRFLVAAAIVLVALVCMGLWMVGTAPGTRVAWRLASSMLPDGITAASIEGRLAGPLVVNGLAVRTATLTVEVERARIEWAPWALLRGVAEIDRIALAGVDVTSLQAGDDRAVAPNSEPGPLPERLDPPVVIRVGELALDDVSYRSAPGAAPVLAERVRLAAQWTEAQLAVTVREARGPQFTLEGDARIAPASPYDTDARFVWTVIPSDYPEVRGITSVAGDLRTLVVEQRIAAPYDIEAEIRIEAPLTAPGLDGDIRFELATADLGGGLPEATMAGALTLSGTPASLELGLDAEVGTAQIGAVSLMARAAVTPAEVEVSRLELRHAESGAVLVAEGAAALTDPPRFEVDARWSDLRWPATGEPDVVSAAGTLELDGGLDDFTLALTGDLTARRVPGQFSVRASGSTESIELDTIELDALGGRATGEASARWSPALDARIALTLAGIDPGALIDDWPGEIDGTLRAAASVDGEALEVEIDELDLAGRLRDRDIAVSAQGRYAGATMEVNQLTLRAGASEIEARASVGERIDADVTLESPNLGDFWPGLSGELSVDASAEGPRLRPRITLDASGRELAVLDLVAGRLDADAAVDLEGEADSRIEIVLANGSVAGTEIERLSVSGRGNAAAHDLALEASTSTGSAALNLNGRLEALWRPDVGWRFDLGEARVDPAGFGGWRLGAPSSGSAGRGRVELERTCWVRDVAAAPSAAAGSELCVDAARTPEQTRAGLSLRELPFAYFAGLASDAVAFEGTLSATGRLSVSAGASPEIDVEVTSTPGRVTPRATGPDAAVEFGALHATLLGRDDVFEAELGWPLTDDGRIEIEARIGAAPSAGGARARTLDARVDASVEDLTFLAPFSDAVEGLRGALRSDLRVSGTLDAPRVAGSVALVDGAVTVPELNATFENVSLALSGDPAGAIDLEASAESGGGTLSATGRFAIADGGTGRVTATGRRFEVMSTADARVVVSPDLELTVDSERLSLTGTVRVPEARITPAGTDAGAVNASRDEVIVAEEAGAETGDTLLRSVHATVVLELGDDVEIEAFGLTGSLGGSLEIVEAPGEPTTGSGELRVEEGTYEAYGQELEVRTGRLLFAGGALTRPGLDIEAVRRPAEGILVGARVRGTLDDPELSLFSEPSMQQQEQLSYLVLGRPLQGASQSEESALSRAALALGLRGGNFVSERINENLGLDEFGIQTAPGESSSTASFVIGKYLSPSLYVSYGIGLFESVSTLNLRYTISDRWTISTESSSEGSGGDIVYSIERSSGRTPE